jgi:hypothetical protein
MRRALWLVEPMVFIEAVIKGFIVRTFSARWIIEPLMTLFGEIRMWWISALKVWVQQDRFLNGSLTGQWIL